MSKSSQLNWPLALSLLALVLSACSIKGIDRDVAGQADPGAVQSSNNATLALLDTADRQQAAGKLEAAAAVIERALRIEPRNPGLWHRLASIRFDQGRYRIAMNLAAKSNSFADKNSRLFHLNKELIQQARRQSGQGTP